jgi:DNA-directed RNA polymerase alpha subunit
MIGVTDDIAKLDLSSRVLNILRQNEINIISDLWQLNRKDLKKLSLTDKEIKSIIISLQLQGLDLNKKMYDK